jgi:hypothetical protein
MALTRDIKEHMEVIGADGVPIGTVDRVEQNRIKLTRKDSGQGSHQGHHHYLPLGLVSNVEGNRVFLSTTGANAIMFREEEDEGSASLVTSGQSPRSQGIQRSSSSSNERSSTSAKSSSLPSWAAPALGLAALTAAGAYFARNRKTETEQFDLQLQTDENMRLISSSKVEGTAVFGRDGERLGRIDSFMVDKYSGRVAYAVLSFGGTMGFAESLFPLPWSALTYDEKKDGYVLAISADQLSRAPKFKPSEAPEFNADYRRSVHRAHGVVVLSR